MGLTKFLRGLEGVLGVEVVEGWSGLRVLLGRRGWLWEEFGVGGSGGLREKEREVVVGWCFPGRMVVGKCGVESETASISRWSGWIGKNGCLKFLVLWYDNGENCDACKVG